MSLPRSDDPEVRTEAQLRAAAMLHETLDGTLRCVVCGFCVPEARKKFEGEALLRAVSHVCPHPDADVAANHKLHYDCWAALDEIMVEAGMDPKLQPADAQAWLRQRLQNARLHDQAVAQGSSERAFEPRLTVTGRLQTPPETQPRRSPSVALKHNVMVPVDYAALEARALAASADAGGQQARVTNWTFRQHAFRCDACGFEAPYVEGASTIEALAEHKCPPGATALSRFRTAAALTALYSGRALVRQAAFDSARWRVDDAPPLALSVVPHGLTCNRCQSFGPFTTELRTSASGKTDYYVRCRCGSWDVSERTAVSTPVTASAYDAAGAYRKAVQAVLAAPIQLDAVGRPDAFATLLVAAKEIDAISKRELGVVRNPAPETSDQRQAALVERDGFMCEAHPGLPFDHDPSCPGPGTPWMLEGRAVIEAFSNERAAPGWTCVGCASRGPFETIKHETPGEPTDYDMACTACGCRDVRESAAEAFQAHVEKCTALGDAPSTQALGAEQ